jgi:ABC-type sugar transport system permease subunit
MYNTTFISHKYGYGLAIAVVQFLFAITISVLFLTASRREIDG